MRVCGQLPDNGEARRRSQAVPGHREGGASARDGGFRGAVEVDRS